MRLAPHSLAVSAPRKRGASGRVKVPNNTGTVTVWDSLKPFKIRWLFQMSLLSQQRLNGDCPRITDGSRNKTMHLEGEEFVRRYLLHVLPKGFTRIRHYGFLAGCCRTQRLAQIHEALAQPMPTEQAGSEQG
jgi:hypothetical protein